MLDGPAAAGELCVVLEDAFGAWAAAAIGCGSEVGFDDVDVFVFDALLWSYLNLKPDGLGYR